MPTLAKVLRELKVEDALLYLDQVKMAFGEKPEIYNKFLDIMKNFKAQEIDTPGVIQQVSRLFRGYNKLILGFNTFLPDGYKIELPLNGDDTTMTVITPSGVTASVVGGRVSQSHVSETEPKRHGSVISKVNTRADTASAPVEFDHAITYVTTIKKRFAHAPETYKAFLEILHTYQKEQRSIKDVLEQVSQLFADHSDLLREFTYFLPDAVQEQAKERLSRAARESELRRARHGGSKYNSGTATIRCAPTDRIRRSASRGSRIVLDSRGSRDLTSNLASTPALANIQADAVADTMTHSRAHSMRKTERTVEHLVFERIRESFLLGAETAIGATDGWNKFLKCLDLYSQDILQQCDLTNLVAELFRSHALCDDQLDALNSMLHGRDHESDRRHQTNSSCALPNRASIASISVPCSRRCRLECSMLNDVSVSPSVGSEGASGNNLIFEQEFFEYEDECFGLDMITDGVFTPLAMLEAMSSISDQGAYKGQHGLGFSSNHFNPILKLYGEHGIELLELLNKTPQHAMPIVVNRLTQRAQSWRRAHEALLGHRPSRITDHHAFLLCQTERKMTLPRYLVQDILDMNAGTPCKDDLYLQLGRSSIQRMLFHLIYNAAERSSIVQSDKQLVIKFWQHFFSQFVQLPADDQTSLSSTNIQPDTRDPTSGAAVADPRCLHTQASPDSNNHAAQSPTGSLPFCF